MFIRILKRCMNKDEYQTILNRTESGLKWKIYCQTGRGVFRKLHFGTWVNKRKVHPLNGIEIAV